MVEINRLVEQQLGEERTFRRSKFGAIVLVTDFGDELAAAECRLSLSSVFQENKIISPELIAVNSIDPFNKVHAAFNLCRLANVAPTNTIFIGVIDPGVGTERNGIIIQTINEHYFVGPDNGIFYPAVNYAGIKSIWRIDETKFPGSSKTFHGRDVFSPTGAKIASGFDPNDLGISIDNLVELNFETDQIVHTDPYGNLKINTSIPTGTSRIILQDGLVIPFVTTFEDVNVGQPLAYLGSSGLLEIAVREGNAAKSLGYKIGDCLNIRPIL